MANISLTERELATAMWLYDDAMRREFSIGRVGRSADVRTTRVKLAHAYHDLPSTLPYAAEAIVLVAMNDGTTYLARIVLADRPVADAANSAKAWLVHAYRAAAQCARDADRGSFVPTPIDMLLAAAEIAARMAEHVAEVDRIKQEDAGAAP